MVTRNVDSSKIFEGTGIYHKKMDTFPEQFFLM